MQLTKVYQQTQPIIAESQVRQKLRFVDRLEMSDRLELDQNAAFDEQVGAIRQLDFMPVIDDWQWNLRLDSQPL